MRTHFNGLNRKFFGQPNGTKAPAKQSKLSFSSKSVAKNEAPNPSSAKENENVEMKEEESDTEVKPKIETKVDVERKENAKLGKGMPVHFIGESQYSRLH